MIRYDGRMLRRRLEALLALSASFLVGALFAIGCGDDTIIVRPGAAVDGGSSGASDDDDFAPSDDDTTAEDAGHDAGKKKVDRDANGPGAEDDTCSFNHDCQLSLRCECDGTCACKPGARGKAEPGEPCADANDCVTGLCIDGPDDKLVCGDECKTAATCPPNLPLCQDISLVGRICTRTPPP